MPRITRFLDEDKNFVPEDEATRMVVREVDDDGEMVSERWYSLAPPRAGDLPAGAPVVVGDPGPVDPAVPLRAALLGGVVGLALGWLVGRIHD